MFKKSLVALALAGASMGAHAVQVLSMTIEEISAVSTLATADASTTGGGIFYFGTEAGDGVIGAGGKTFISAGSTDGQINMGATQGNGAFTTGFLYGGSNPLFFTFSPNTSNGAPSADTNGTVNLSGFGGYWNATAKNYPLFPDSGTLITAWEMIDSTHFYYTMDWSHVITAAEDVDFQTQRADWHLEGIATTAPVPEASTYGMMLAGLGLVGLVVRRRKQA